mgnify:CR=1 FL=1
MHFYDISFGCYEPYCIHVYTMVYTYYPGLDYASITRVDCARHSVRLARVSCSDVASYTRDLQSD